MIFICTEYEQFTPTTHTFLVPFDDDIKTKIPENNMTNAVNELIQAVNKFKIIIEEDAKIRKCKVKIKPLEVKYIQTQQSDTIDNLRKSEINLVVK